MIRFIECFCYIMKTKYIKRNDFLLFNIMENSIIDGGCFNGTHINLCAYSLCGFIEDDDKRKIADQQCKYIEKHCKHWHYFGDGLCFSCSCEETICPFDKFLKNEIDKKEE